MSWIRRLARSLRRASYRGRHARTARDPFNQTLMRLPLTPLPPAADPGPWRPRITRWVRLAQPQPDDTVISMPAVELAVLLPHFERVAP